MEDAGEAGIAMPPRPTALLVMPAGAARRAAATALSGAFHVRTASEPYAATVSFAERPTDLVVLDLGTFRSRDRAFLRVVRRRSPAARVLLLLPEGARRRAVAALEAGADAYVLDPFHPGELVAVARRLLRDQVEGGLGADPGPLIRLSSEVAHAVNNPLQVLSLAAEGHAGPRAPLADPTMRETVGRIRDVVALLNAYGRLGPPHRQPVDYGKLLRTAVETAAKAGLVRVTGSAPADGPEGLADALQLREALGALLQYVAASATALPAEISVRCRRARRGDPADRLQVLVPGLELPAEELAAAPGIVLTSHERTRQPHPGLALPAAVARLHGGTLVLRAGKRGLVLTLRLPH
jgi:DNA-binding NarL/FixJ family response regulator